MANIPTICLNMIVKNESKIILRLIQSVLPVIDNYCICDTGSTDNTVEMVQKFFQEKNIPGKIIHEPFKDFAHNRNVALNACSGMSDYILFLDADMVLDIKNFNKEQLNEYDFLYILQGNEGFYYQNVRIVRNNGLYSYTGVTHEYINTPGNSKNKLFKKDELFIIDIGDGGAKSDKFERDIRLLTNGIKDEPQNACRYYFYLANSYMNSGKNEEAIETYKKRIDCGGWVQEIWYSNYNIGHCYKNLNKIHDAIYYWLECFNVLPERIESLYEIMMHYRVISKHNLSFHFNQIAKEILKKNIFRDDYLFLNNDVYTYKINYEFSIIACYLGIKNINDDVITILNNSCDGSINNNLLNNMKFYKDILVAKHKTIADDKIFIKINNEDIEFHSSSSCLIQQRTANKFDKEYKYLMNIRYVNYYITENGSYINCDKNIITVNKLIELDKNFEPISRKNYEIYFDNKKYIGIEDIRIFNDVNSDNILFIGTALHDNGFLGVVTGKYDITSNKRLVPIEINQQFNKSNCEKNWVFFDYYNSTHIVYNWFPLQICKLDQETKNIELVATKEMPRIFSHVRGSTCGFKYIKQITHNDGLDNDNIMITCEENELWFVVHVVSYEWPRHYYHMIVVFDEEMKLLRYSAPFKFEGEPIEYCLSIVVEDERVLINYSTWDRTTRIGFYDKKYIEQMLKYTP